MKLINTLAFGILFTILAACSPDGPPKNTNDAANTQAGTATAAVQHYICSNNCAGGGGPAAGTCSVCGSALVHNQAYHDQGNATPTIPSVNPNGPIDPANQDPSVTANTAQNAAGVFHYTCSAGCGGGGAAQGPCPQCGAALAHNQAYHDQTAAPTANPNAPSSPIIQQTQTQVTSPAQNAAGVFHYTCSAGCGGGGAAQGSCPQCGAALAHNQAYHQ